MQVNQPKGGNAEAITTTLAVGDQVSYLAVAVEGRGYRLSARTGVIKAIDGGLATVRASNGRTITQPIEKLTLAGEPNALTRMLDGSH